MKKVSKREAEDKIRVAGRVLTLAFLSFSGRSLHYLSSPTPAEMDGPILHYVFSCLKSPAVRPPVVTAIMQLVDNLLNNGGEAEASATEPPAKRRAVATTAEATPSELTEISHERGNVAASTGTDVPALAQRRSEGEELLLPHLHLILDRLGSFVVDGTTSGMDKASSKSSPSSKHVSKVPLQYLSSLSR